METKFGRTRMRKIEFRGQRTCDNEWVYGWFIGVYQTEDGDVGCIRDYTGKDNLVKLETIGQYTGLEDENGKKIFEGDIFKDNKNQYGMIFHSDKQASFLVNWKMKDGSYETDNCFGYQVIGNIHDNKELLEEQK